MKPTFLGLGAQKCASTWLHDLLSDHPQVCMAELKEIDFFSYWYDFGLQWYERHFAHPERPAIGEISPSYFHNPLVPQRIRRYAPGMRLILMLRNPVTRAESNHRHEVRTGHVAGDDLSFEFGLKNNPSYIEQGRYATHLERWYQFFPREQVHVVIVDEPDADRAQIARGIFNFLGIDTDHLSRSADRAANVSSLRRSPQLEALRQHAQAGFHRLGMQNVWSLAANAGAQRIYRHLNWQRPEEIIPPAKPATIDDLKELFKPEILRLQTLLGRSLHSWLT
jgi:hypothetical protein